MVYVPLSILRKNFLKDKSYKYTFNKLCYNISYFCYKKATFLCNEDNNYLRI